MVCYAEKQEKPFRFSSLGHMVQFGAIIFCRTFKNYFGQFVWIEKSHYSSRVSLHEAPTNKRPQLKSEFRKNIKEANEGGETYLRNYRKKYKWSRRTPTRLIRSVENVSDEVSIQPVVISVKND